MTGVRPSRFTESQIVAILKETDTGMKVGEVCRKHDISQPTYYNWKSKYGGLSVSDLKRTKELEAELSKLHTKCLSPCITLYLGVLRGAV